MICAYRPAALSGKGCALDSAGPNGCEAGSWLEPRARLRGPLRHFASGRERATPEDHDQLAQRREHALVTFAQESGQDVLADLVAPEMISAIAARHSGGVEIHPVGLDATRDAITPRPNARGVEL